eukprot:6311691-Amphidinium_carterae.2
MDCFECQKPTGDHKQLLNTFIKREAVSKVPNSGVDWLQLSFGEITYLACRALLQGTSGHSSHTWSQPLMLPRI